MTGPTRPDDDEPIEPASGEEPVADEDALDEDLSDEELAAEEAGDEVGPVDERAAAAEPVRRGATVPVQATTQRAAGDELPYVDDPVSKIFVAAMVVVFGGIIIFALLFGRAGVLTPDKTRPPSPEASPTLSAEPTLEVSPEASPTASPEASPTEGETGSPEASPSASPTGPTGSPSPTSAAPTTSPGATGT